MTARAFTRLNRRQMRLDRLRDWLPWLAIALVALILIAALVRATVERVQIELAIAAERSAG